MKTAPATARLEARISADLHDLLRRAAEIQGRSMTDFIVEAVRIAVQEAIEETATLKLVAKDQIRFANAFLSPPKPSAALKKAFARHRKLVKPA